MRTVVKLFLPYTMCLMLILSGCGVKNNKESILLDEKINFDFIQTMDDPERALLSWYLFAYGNECDSESPNSKCIILKALGVDDECNEEHINFLKRWFRNDILIQIKLKKCPCLSLDNAIQNEYKNISLNRSGYKLTIEYEIWGMNNSEEKSWNVMQRDSYMIKGSELVKMTNQE